MFEYLEQKGSAIGCPFCEKLLKLLVCQKGMPLRTLLFGSSQKGCPLGCPPWLETTKKSTSFALGKRG